MTTSTFQLSNFGDLVINGSNGRPVMITGTPKFTQDVQLNLSLNPQVNGTGAGLGALVGTIGDSFSIRSLISARINNAFAAYQNVQNSIQKYDRGANERFNSVSQVTVLPIQNSSGSLASTSYAWRVDVQSIASSSGNTSATSTVTGVIAS